MARDKPDHPYVGFWNRTAAALIDSALLIVITLPLQQALSGGAPGSASARPTGFWDPLVGYVLPAAAILVFWKYRSATPSSSCFATWATTSPPCRCCSA